MRYDPASRVMSLSFIRDTAEHTEVMIETGRRMMTGTEPIAAWTALGIALGFGVIVGIVMEIHRLYVLPIILGPSEIAPLSTVMLQLLPLVILIAALYGLLSLRAARRRRNALLSRLQAGLYIDVEIFPAGLISSSGGLTIEIEWPIVRDIFVEARRIELECESFSVYIPERAFPNRAAFNEAAKEIRNLWREAVKHDRDSKMVAAGLE